MIPRFMDKVMPEPNSGCWLWMATADEKGYGHFGIAAGKARKAHRVSYELFVGPIPAGQIVCHKCDNPSCVNPEHLFIGSHQDNADDRGAKGRTALGEANGKSVLNADAARWAKTCGLSLRATADVLSVSPGAIAAIRRGRTWVHAMEAS